MTSSAVVLGPGGPDITSLATWVPAYQAGIRQAPQAARLIGAGHPVRQRSSGG